MKKFIFIFFTIFLSLTFNNCTKTINEPYITIDNAVLPAFDGVGGEQQFEIVSNYKWSAYSDQIWCKVSPESGSSGKSTITVTTDANTSMNARIRTATITITANGAQEHVTIMQDVPVFYSITMITEGNGTASSSHSTAAAGTQVTIAAASQSGSTVFKEWTVVPNNVTISSTTTTTTTTTATFIMPACDVEIKAWFEPAK